MDGQMASIGIGVAGGRVHDADERDLEKGDIAGGGVRAQRTLAAGAVDEDLPTGVDHGPALLHRGEGGSGRAQKGAQAPVDGLPSQRLVEIAEQRSPGVVALRRLTGAGDLGVELGGEQGGDEGILGGEVTVDGPDPHAVRGAVSLGFALTD